MNVVLIGYRATGKTSVGRCLARRLGAAFHDTDEEVSRRTGSTVRELVARGGWELFRREEKKVVASLSEMDGCVLSLGGGAVVDPENRRRLQGLGFVVWLRADAETVVRRLEEDRKSGEQRPPLSGEDLKTEVTRMLREREEIYRGTAHLLVETAEKTIDEVAEEILRCLNKIPLDPPLPKGEGRRDGPPLC